jgi:predicted Zn-dependent protease
LFLATVAAGGAYAWGGRAIHWTRIPTITVVSEDGDPRREAVREAVAFWNRTFGELESPFRLGKVTWVTASVPGRAESLDRYSGDVLILLSNATFVSYTAQVGDRVVIAIKNGDSWPLSLPNVLRNVVTHELGHAVGLGHNGDPKLLMCGRPASCRPDAFESASSRIFPLSEAERDRLLSFYGGTP